MNYYSGKCNIGLDVMCVHLITVSRQQVFIRSLPGRWTITAVWRKQKKVIKWHFYKQEM